MTEVYDCNPANGLLSGQRVLRDSETLLNLSYNYERPGRSGVTRELVRATDNLDPGRTRNYDYDALGPGAGGGESQIADPARAQRIGGEPVAVRAKLRALRGPDQASRASLQALLEQGTIVERQQPLRDVHPAVGVDPDQMVVEGGVVDFRECDAVGHDRLAHQLVGVGHDVGGVEEVVVGQIADRAPVIVGGEHPVPEGGLMQSLLDQAEGEAAPDRVIWGTDWPHPNISKHMPNDGDLVDLVPKFAPDPAMQRRVLVDNPARLYDF